jgi:hypothetical protein
MQKSPVIQQANPQGWECTDGTTGPPVCPAHLHIALQAHFREDGCQMGLPVLQAGVLPCIKEAGVSGELHSGSADGIIMLSGEQEIFWLISSRQPRLPSACKELAHRLLQQTRGHYMLCRVPASALAGIGCPRLRRTGVLGHPALHVFPEGTPLLCGVLVLAIAVQEVHGHIQSILHIALKAKVLVPHERQHPRPVRIHVCPHMAAPACIACTAQICWFQMKAAPSYSAQGPTLLGKYVDLSGFTELSKCQV